MEEYENIQVTMELILAAFSKKSEEKRLKDIKSYVVAQLISNPNSLFDGRQEEVEKSIEEIIKADKKLGDASLLTYNRGKYKQRKNKNLPGGADPYLQNNDFIGRAGECAVMSELLYRGYNVNSMMVDGGVDLVAFKDTFYYFFQVKTVGVKDGCIHASIPIESFEKNRIYSSQMRYVIVGRYLDKNGNPANHYFVFSQEDIEKEMYDKTIKRGIANISIKVKFNERSGEPMLYDGDNERGAAWYRNRF